MKARFFVHSLLLSGFCALQGIAQEAIPEIEHKDFDRLHALIQPCPGESPWREIAWETNVTEARRRAIEEDKPLVIFHGGRWQSVGAYVRRVHVEPRPVVHRRSGRSQVCRPELHSARIGHVFSRQFARVGILSESGAGGNHLVSCTASGMRLGAGSHLKLRERELALVVAEYQKLSKAARAPSLALSDDVEPPRRPVPQPPTNGLIVRGFCTYLERQENEIDRATRFYYKQNPDRWVAETQSDMLWLTESEWRSLVPSDPQLGDTLQVAASIQHRFYSTIGIDYMEGSVNSLPPRETTMTITVEKVAGDTIALRLDGVGRMGKPITDESLKQEHSRGCAIRVLGQLQYNRKTQKFERFDLVGVGRAWGNKMNYVRREVFQDDYPWMYGIACQLVTGDSPIDRIPPYNLLHYNSTGKYFASE